MGIIIATMENLCNDYTRELTYIKVFSTDLARVITNPHHPQRETINVFIPGHEYTVY